MPKINVKKEKNINTAYIKCKDEVCLQVRKKTTYRLEKDVEKEIKKIYTNLGWDCYGIQSKLGCPPGVADLVFFKDGQIMFIEVKSPVAWDIKNHNLSDKQIKFLKQAKGYVATIIDNEIKMELIE